MASHHSREPGLGAPLDADRCGTAADGEQPCQQHGVAGKDRQNGGTDRPIRGRPQDTGRQNHQKRPLHLRSWLKFASAGHPVTMIVGRCFSQMTEMR